MKIAVLLSGGKDSLLAAYIASLDHELVCAITIKSENLESYMYHTPNIDIVHLQAEAMQIPLILKTTKGEKEIELEALDNAILEAINIHGVDCIVTGAVASQYQASRVQRICAKHNITCFNPLWQMNQVHLLKTLIALNFTVIIAGVFAYPFTESWLGNIITTDIVEKLINYQETYKINPAGEGGEIESLVLDCPLFHSKIIYDQTTQEYANYAGTFSILEAHLEQKTETSISKALVTTTLQHPLLQNTISTSADVLVITTHAKKLQGFEREFVFPILDCIQKEQKTARVISLDAFTGDEEERCIIITGTTFEDDDFLRYKESFFSKLKSDVSVLGICAGMELLLPKQIQLQQIEEIGPITVRTVGENSLFSNMDETSCYFLHHNGIQQLEDEAITNILITDSGIATFKYTHRNIYGVQFHPEVNQKQIIKKFILLHSNQP